MEARSSPYPQKMISIQRITNMESIMFVKGNINYTDLIFISGKRKTISRTLKCFETSAKFEHWLRVHRGFLVNPKYIQAISYHTLTLELKDGQKLPISRRRLMNLKNFKMTMR